MKRFTYLLIICIFYINTAIAQRPNILLIVTDQHSGVVTTQHGYDYITTPGIDKIASLGVAFTRSYTPYPVCMAMRSSLMTGVMPSKSSKDLTSYQSIGTRAKEAGYTTAYYGKWHVGHSKMNKVEAWHGFETYIDSRKDTEIKNWSVDFLKESHDKPFFLVTSFLNPHNCCELARSMAGMKKKVKYTDGAVEENMTLDECPPLPENFAIPEDEAEGFYCRRFPDTTNMTQFGKHPVKYWNDDRWRQYMYGYDRLVEKVDAHVLDIINTLEAQSLLENTMIIYTSDHGDGHAAHMWNQKMTFYEESVNVPFIVAWKGKTRSGIIDKKHLVNNTLDLYATLSVLFEADNGDRYGIDICPLVMLNGGKQTEQHDYVISEITQKSKKEGCDITYVGRMVVTENYKYMLFDKGENREQFFDLRRDEGEMHNLIAMKKHKKEILKHRNMLKDWIDMTSDVFDINDIP